MDDQIKALAGAPQIRLHGPISEETLTSFLDQLGKAEGGEGPIAVEVTTTGGDAEVGRRLALEMKIARSRLKRRLVFIGKTVVYSAGATMMSGVPAHDRYLTADTLLLIHCRTLTKTLDLDGPLKASLARLDQVLSEIDSGLRLQREGYLALIEGSSVSFEEVEAKAEKGWHVPAAEAVERGLAAGIV